MLDAIIISDLHLGSDICQATHLIYFLKLIEDGKLRTKDLILNGDVFDSWDFRRLKKNHWKVLSHLRSLSDHFHIVWISGNHDQPAEIISHLIGVEVAEEYIFMSGNKKILCMHGHMFDKFISEHPIVTYLADTFYHLIQKIDNSFYLAKMAKRSSKTFLRCSELIKERAIEYAKKHKCDIVCCGHSHLAEATDIYYNSGCWTEPPCSYLTVKNGEVQLKYFKEE